MSTSPVAPAVPELVIEPPHTRHHQTFWLWVMCLTGVDYFSTLAYQPSIAFEATGLLAPLATLFLVAITLVGAVPVYCYVAAKSPHGMGSIAMLEKLVHGWKGKMLVLVLLGFAATDFVITKTLSAADAAEHVIHNPSWSMMPAFIHQFTEDRQRLALTMFLLVLLGASFLRGFREVVKMAVVIVISFMALNVIIIGSGLFYLATHPSVWHEWTTNLSSGNWHLENPILPGRDAWTIALLCFLYFPNLALGLSGFETGVAVMPLIKGYPDDSYSQPKGRIRNTRKLLVAAAMIMSVFLLSSSFCVTTLINPDALEPDGPAANRALAYLAHGEGERPINPLFGEVFGTVYDITTVVILWFAGASAMAALINLVPQYLPRYGMAPEWTSAVRPLVILFTGINLLVTWIFNADVLAQGGAYATGVLVLICSACAAVVIDHFKQHDRPWYSRIPWFYLAVAAIFVYTAAANMIERPDGLKIASCFIVVIVASSFLSRQRRSTELRFHGFQFADVESKFLWDSMKHLEFPVLVPHRPGRRELIEKEESIRRRHRLAGDVPIVFIEADLGDPSEFHQSPLMEIRQSGDRFVIGVTRCVSIAHVIAIIALELSKVGKPPEIHFGWSDENPLAMSLSFFLFGEGNVPWMVRELIRKAEPNSDKRPQVIIG